VVRAGEALGIALLFPAHHRAAVRAGVEVHLHRAVVRPPQEELPASDLARDEIAGLRDFRRVAGVNPAAAEYLRALLVQHRGIGKCPARHQKLAALRIDTDEMRRAQAGFDGLVHKALRRE
jgi:hypothetical protein